MFTAIVLRYLLHKEFVGKLLMVNNQKKAGNLCPTFRL